MPRPPVSSSASESPHCGSCSLLTPAGGAPPPQRHSRSTEHTPIRSLALADHDTPLRGPAEVTPSGPRLPAEAPSVRRSVRNGSADSGFLRDEAGRPRAPHC